MFRDLCAIKKEMYTEISEGGVDKIQEKHVELRQNLIFSDSDWDHVYLPHAKLVYYANALKTNMQNDSCNIIH